ncbi:hypothetical protein [Sphingomonas sp.]|uniref:hypothetical protein n=1 Tax=Sphingomonas sp. TaxID=28214 RepID=UPI003CC576B5
MEISFDPAKREETLRERALDFADAGALFAGTTLRMTGSTIRSRAIRPMASWPSGWC